MHFVSLTFDDGLPCHLDKVVPRLEAHGFRGTFYVSLNSSSFWERVADWRAAADRGHELGNHTLFHPATRGKSYISEGNAIERYTLDRMRLELETANTLLGGLDGRSERSFAYPCCNPVLGSPGLARRLLGRLGLDRTRAMGWVHRWPWLDIGSSQVSYEPVAAELFPVARTGGERFHDGSQGPPRRSSVPSVALDGKSIAEIEPVVEAFLACESGWLVFMAHGIDGGHHLSCEASVLEWLLSALRTADVAVRTVLEASRGIYGGIRHA